MTYEEIGDMKSCQLLVCDFLKLNIKLYSNPFQRPGHLVPSLEAKVRPEIPISSLHSSPSHITNKPSHARFTRVLPAHRSLGGTRSP